MRIPVLFKTAHTTAERGVLVDSGATDNFISKNLLKRLKIGATFLETPIKVWNVDGTHNQAGAITENTILEVRVGEEVTKMRFLITELGKDEVILGYPWLAAFEPVFHWKDATLDEKFQPVVITSTGKDPHTIEAAIRAIETYCLEESTWEQMIYEEEPYFAIKKTTTATKLAQEAAEPEEKTLEEMIPPKYLRHKKVFSEEESHRFPLPRPWDISIDLIPDAPTTLDCKIYPLTRPENDALSDYLTEELQKGYIRPSKSPYASPFFFVEKKNKKLRPVIDFRALNKYTTPNRYPLPLIPEVIDKARGAARYTKVDIRWGYNNVRIKEGDEWKTAFKTNQGMFEYLVMPFGLRNAPAAFQAMMDHEFRDLTLSGKVIIYMDDILIATGEDEHEEWVHKVLDRLEQLDLYLKPEKCVFDQKSVEYLGVILEEGAVSMAPDKVKGIREWPTPTTLTQLRAFIGFCNFYRRFIKGFSAIARPLNDLLKKNTPWHWVSDQWNAFLTLKEKVCSEPVLTFPDFDKPFTLEVDASAFAVGAVLSQEGKDGKLHPIAYHSETFTQAERNYDIYDRELLAVVKSLRHWRHYLAGAIHKTTIFTDHSNLQYWKEPRKISRRVAREYMELQEYDFELRHVPGAKNARADALSRRSDYDTGEEDNTDIIVLPSDVFAQKIQATLHDVDIWCQAVQQTDEHEVLRWVDPHNLKKHDGLWWKDDALVVGGNNELRRGVIFHFHDTPSMGHPGIANTYALLRRDFWWPNMKKDVEEYVRGCATCQANKVNTHQITPALFPIETDPNAHPFEVVSMDFITKLPKSGGYDTILTITDHDCTKAAVFIPCNETIDAKGVAALYLRHIYPHFGLPRRIISDRDPRFTSSFARNLCKTLDIHQNISTAYHPQTDGQSERSNQWLEQYLRHWCNAQQDNWSDWLPTAQFAHNSWPSATTKSSPFSLLMGWEPRTTWLEKPTNVPSVEQRLGEMMQKRQQAQEAIRHTQKRWIGRKQSKFVPYQPGDQVWLEATNLRTHFPTAKLAPKRFGPFPIKRVLSPVTFELELPSHWKIHPVFHGNLLTPYRETKLHGENFTRPPPDLVDGEEEWEVEEILDARRKGRGRKLHFLVKWKGFPDSDNSWEPADFLHADDLIGEFYQRYPNKEGAPGPHIRTLWDDEIPCHPPFTSTIFDPNKSVFTMSDSPISRSSSVTSSYIERDARLARKYRPEWFNEAPWSTTEPSSPGAPSPGPAPDDAFVNMLEAGQSEPEPYRVETTPDNTTTAMPNLEVWDPSVEADVLRQEVDAANPGSPSPSPSTFGPQSPAAAPTPESQPPIPSPHSPSPSGAPPSPPADIPSPPGEATEWEESHPSTDDLDPDAPPPPFFRNLPMSTRFFPLTIPMSNGTRTLAKYINYVNGCQDVEGTMGKGQPVYAMSVHLVPLPNTMPEPMSYTQMEHLAEDNRRCYSIDEVLRDMADYRATGEVSRARKILKRKKAVEMQRKALEDQLSALEGTLFTADSELKGVMKRMEAAHLYRRIAERYHDSFALNLTNGISPLPYPSASTLPAAPGAEHPRPPLPMTQLQDEEVPGASQGGKYHANGKKLCYKCRSDNHLSKDCPRRKKWCRVCSSTTHWPNHCIFRSLGFTKAPPRRFHPYPPPTPATADEDPIQYFDSDAYDLVDEGNGYGRQE
jgi:hypothetical protein